MRYFLDSDEDGHWFIIPTEKSEEWQVWLDGIYNAYSNSPLPEYVIRVNGSPQLVSFENWRIDS